MEVVDPPLEQKLKEYVRGSSEEGAILERLEQAFFVHGATYVAPDAAPDVTSDATPDVE